MFKIYNVKEDYINYLRMSEPNILMNKSEKRPYIGVVYTVNSIDYFIPLSSPKPRFNNMKNSKDFHKINEGKYGVINFNKMLPICKCQLIELDIDSETDIAYKKLLQNQYQELIKLKNVVYKKSQDIYNLYCSNDDKLTPSDIRVKNRCCNFILLEQKMQEYIAEKQKSI